MTAISLLSIRKQKLVVVRFIAGKLSTAAISSCIYTPAVVVQ